MHATTWILASLLVLPLAGTLGAPWPEAGPAASQDDEKDEKHPSYEHLNLSKKGLALKGYDPVAYFPEHGGAPSKGNPKLAAKHRAVTYYFVSERNRQAFLADPERFEPRYGGWCAWALAEGKGEKVDPSPKAFTVEGGELYLFYDGLWGDTRQEWIEAGGAEELAPKADANWARITRPKDGR